MKLINDIAWAAGFIEGEGHIRYQPAKRGGSFVLTATQALLEPLEKLKGIFGGYIHEVKRKPNRKQCWTWNCCGIRGAAASMTIYQLLSSRRQEQAKGALVSWRSAPGRVLKTCRLGHPFTEENTRHYTCHNGRKYRRCLTCMREYDRKWHNRKYHLSRGHAWPPKATPNTVPEESIS